jgi:hypothetical protein
LSQDDRLTKTGWSDVEGVSKASRWNRKGYDEKQYEEISGCNRDCFARASREI